jgi:hypothetical protein
VSLRGSALEAYRPSQISNFKDAEFPLVVDVDGCSWFNGYCSIVH